MGLDFQKMFYISADIYAMVNLESWIWMLILNLNLS